MNIKKLIINLTLLIIMFLNSSVLTNAVSYKDDSLTLDKNNSSHHDISIEFGRNQSKLFYEIQAVRFVFDKALRIEGNNSIIGYLYIALNHLSENSAGKIFLGINNGSWESLEWENDNKRFQLSNDLNIEGELFVNGSPLSSGTTKPSFSQIKILPKDFEVYQERVGISNIYDFGATQLVEYGEHGMIASYEIPEGYKATKTRIYGDGGSFDISIYECSLNNTNCTNVGNGQTNMLINNQDVNSTSLNFLSIIVDERKIRTNPKQYIHGGYIVLEEI